MIIKNVIKLALVIFFSATPAFAANSITVVTCASDYIEFTWNVDDLTVTGTITVSNTNDASDTHIVPLVEQSGRFSGNIAGAWSGSNENVDVFFTDLTSVTATCPSD